MMTFKKHIHRILFYVLILFVSPYSLAYADMQGEFESALLEPTSTIKISMKGSSVNVQNGQGQMIEVFSVTGKKIASTKISSPDETFDFSLSRGCYIVKVGQVVRKVSVL